MNDVTRIGTSTVYNFPRPVRHGQFGPETDEAVVVRSRGTVRTLRAVYRKLRQAGHLDFEARIDLWLLLADKAETTTLRKVDL